MSAIIIAIANQKGGIGKTTLTTIISTTLYNYDANISVAVIDADFQNSFSSLRENDIILYNALSDKSIVKEPYPIYRPGEKGGDIIIETIKTLEEIKNKYNIIFVDMPGTVNQKGMGTLLKMIHNYFIPIYPDYLTLASSIGFIEGLKKFKNTENSQIKTISCFFNKYSDRTNKEQIIELEKLFKNNNISLMECKVYNKVGYEREHRSTIFPYPYEELPPNLEKKSIYGFIKEMIEII